MKYYLCYRKWMGTGAIWNQFEYVLLQLQAPISFYGGYVGGHKKRGQETLYQCGWATEHVVSDDTGHKGSLFLLYKHTPYRLTDF